MNAIHIFQMRKLKLSLICVTEQDLTPHVFDHRALFLLPYEGFHIPPVQFWECFGCIDTAWLESRKDYSSMLTISSKFILPFLPAFS